MDVIFGDDDLFINVVVMLYNIWVIFLFEVFVFFKVKSSWRGYYCQKLRYLLIGIWYCLVYQFLLGVLLVSYFGYYVFGFVLILFYNLEIIVFINYLVWIVVVMVMYGFIMRKF